MLVSSFFTSLTSRTSLVNHLHHKVWFQTWFWKRLPQKHTCPSLFIHHSSFLSNLQTANVESEDWRRTRWAIFCIWPQNKPHHEKSWFCLSNYYKTNRRIKAFKQNSLMWLNGGTDTTTVCTRAHTHASVITTIHTHTHRIMI